MKAKTTMKAEIKKRLENSEWSAGIAAGVISRKKRGRKIFISALSSISAAAVVTLFFVFGTTTDTSNLPGYESMISRQVHGTYNATFSNTGKSSYSSSRENTPAKEAEKNSPVASFDDVILSDETDTVIDDALAMR